MQGKSPNLGNVCEHLLRRFDFHRFILGFFLHHFILLSIALSNSLQQDAAESEGKSLCKLKGIL